MRKIIAAVLLLAVLATAARAQDPEWRFLGSLSDEVAAFYAPDTVERRGALAGIYLMLARITGDGVSKHVYTFAINCDTGLFLLRSVDGGAPSRPAPVQPGTPAEMLRDLMCGAPLTGADT